MRLELRLFLLSFILFLFSSPSESASTHVYKKTCCVLNFVLGLKKQIFLSGDLKKICETDLGLISQCCLTKYVFKINRQYLSNVALKINVKVCITKFK